MRNFLQDKAAQSGQSGGATHSATDGSRSAGGWPQPRASNQAGGGLGGPTPGLTGNVAQGNAARGDGQYQSGGNPGSKRVVQGVPYQDGEPRREQPRHPDKGQDPKDTAMYHDGNKWRWR